MRPLSEACDAIKFETAFAQTTQNDMAATLSQKLPCLTYGVHSSTVTHNPPENRSPKGTGDTKKIARDQAPHGEKRVQNPAQQGQQGNTKLNTANQGYQQDR
jgi:hypothetical protein